MRIQLASILILFSFYSRAESNTLLNQAGNDLELTNKINTQKELKLDNPFLIQLFAATRAYGQMTPAQFQWFDLVIQGENQKALSLLKSVKQEKNTPKLKSIIESSELYLLHKVSLDQAFYIRFIEVATQSDFLNTELGIALDQVVGGKASSIILEKGLFLTPTEASNLAKIEKTNSKINFSLQSVNALKKGDKAVEFIGKLDKEDYLRVPLAETSLLHFAKQGKLGASGKILKDVVEPIMLKSGSTDELSLYFITLGRLLYQAGAYAESKKYYDLIPESSKHFLKAKTEVLWATLMSRDYSRTKGELASLENKIFQDRFYPEAYLISAMANVTLCQFVEAKKSIERFVSVNKKFATEVESNLNNPNAKPIQENFYLLNLERFRKQIALENNRLAEYDLQNEFKAAFDAKISQANQVYNQEIQQQWKNRKAMLESAIYKMKFAKVELVSRMRSVELQLALTGIDEVREQKAATKKNNDLVFKAEKNLWGDELFHMSAHVKNKCINGQMPTSLEESKL